MNLELLFSKAEQSRAEQRRAEESRAEEKAASRPDQRGGTFSSFN